MLSDSVKEKDPMKVGRFGLGFKSVFHMTGTSYLLLPAEIARNYIFNPDCNNLYKLLFLPKAPDELF